MLKELIMLKEFVRRGKYELKAMRIKKKFSCNAVAKIDKFRKGIQYAA